MFYWSVRTRLLVAALCAFALWMLVWWAVQPITVG